jgi:choline dehydrogenase-like flavoprotein
MTLKECQAYPNFKYRPETYVTHFGYDGRRVTGVACEDAATGERFRLPAENLVLAAGTLMTAQIFLASFWEATGSAPRLTGLMDNRQVMVPFVNLKMVGRRYDPDTYQYHQLAMGFAADDPRDYVHCQITTLKTALIHPLLQGPPLGLRTAVYLFRHLRAALGLVNVNLADTRREENYIGLEPDPAGGRPRLVVRYRPAADEPGVIRRALKKVNRALWALGCVVPPGMTHVRPMGASVHYAGTVPLSTTPRPLTASPDGRSHDFENLFFADGTTFPFLPAKNLTYTLMANAVRVAARAF